MSASVTWSCSEFAHIVSIPCGGAGDCIIEPTRTARVVLSTTERKVTISLLRGRMTLMTLILESVCGATLWESPVGGVVFDTVHFDFGDVGVYGVAAYEKYPLGKPKLNATCPCGIDRRDCEYHK